jgi:hypothetical protein
MIAHGYWPRVCNVAPDLKRIPFPWYLVSVNNIENVEVVNYDDTIHRTATANEASRLTQRYSVGPAVLDAGFKAYHGLGEWMPHYEKLKFENVKRCELKN